MDMTTCLKSLLLAIQQYRAGRTAQNAAQLQKQVEVSCAAPFVTGLLSESSISRRLSKRCTSSCNILASSMFTGILQYNYIQKYTNKSVCFPYFSLWNVVHSIIWMSHPCPRLWHHSEIWQCQHAYYLSRYMQYKRCHLMTISMII